MELGIRMVVIAGAAIALSATLASAAGESEAGISGAPNAFAPYGEDFTRGEPIPPEMLKTIEHAKPLLFPEENRPRAAEARPHPPRRNAEGTSASSLPTAQGVPLPRTGL
jgi:hypothetical protein